MTTESLYWQDGTIQKGSRLVRIVAAPHDENDILAENRARLSSWAPSNGWMYVEYLDVFDLLSRISDLQITAFQQVAEIEIVAHGNPAVCNDLVLGNAM